MAFEASRMDRDKSSVVFGVGIRMQIGMPWLDCNTLSGTKPTSLV